MLNNDDANNSDSESESQIYSLNSINKEQNIKLIEKFVDESFFMTNRYYYSVNPDDNFLIMIHIQNKNKLAIKIQINSQLNINNADNIFYKGSVSLYNDNKLYISGGFKMVNKEKYSLNNFYIINSYKDKPVLESIKYMIYPRHNHKMFYIKGDIVILGGPSTTIIEKYDIKNKTFIQFDSALTIKRSFFNHYLDKNYLIIFFGKDNDHNYIEFGEKINIKNYPSIEIQKIEFKLKNNDLNEIKDYCFDVVKCDKKNKYFIFYELKKYSKYHTFSLSNLFIDLECNIIDVLTEEKFNEFKPF